ncbi:BCCT family transporter [Oryzicola mucosus]|uniref:BCCT family transporter n=1 Tax=Oryzicola mucosus TaxID=2767425 RepID=A0A8J6PII9_9HYPH|nr:BCCT family transporter [Oryzicola mucosus]MBD0414768.1 BCCT family transporter [Oryzicola mucosus]
MFSTFVINKPVFFGSVAIITLFVGVGALLPEQAEAIFGTLQAEILARFGWLYLLAVGIFLFAVIILAAGRFGDLKLGPDDSEPDFAYISWMAMLFAAGMGIGLMYFAVGEPLTHYAVPPTADPLTAAAQREAMSVTFFHWGIHAWAIYAVVGLSLAYFGYRYNLPLTIRSGLYPLLKHRIYGFWGHVVDIAAICGTVFGLATSLGFGVLQISAGLEYLLGLEATITMQVGLIIVITAIAACSVVTGVEKGVRILSEVNLGVAVLLMLFVLAVGPTSQLMRDFVQNIGLYLDTLLLRTFNIYAYEPTPWVDNWTLFYWAWWISWSPFVGMFIARISRGRTVREFVVAVLFIPAGFTFLWMTVFGNTAIFLDQTVAAGQLAKDVQADISVGLFQFFQYLPWPAVTSTLAVLLVSIFFVTSSDSGSLVVDTIASGGETNTGAAQRLFWCAIEGTVAAVLLMTGGLRALQSATIATALPFTFVLLVLVWALFKGMKADVAQGNAHGQPAKQAHPATGITWQRRLALIINAPTVKDIDSFIERTALPALESVAEELSRRGRPATVEHNAEAETVSLNAPAEDFRNFIYGVQRKGHKLPAFSVFEAVKMDQRYEAKTFFSDGSKGYDIMGMSREQIISDVLFQYERYLNIVQSEQTSLVVTAPEHS